MCWNRRDTSWMYSTQFAHQILKCFQHLFESVPWRTETALTVKWGKPDKGTLYQRKCQVSVILGHMEPPSFWLEQVPMTAVKSFDSAKCLLCCFLVKPIWIVRVNRGVLEKRNTRGRKKLELFFHSFLFVSRSCFFHHGSLWILGLFRAFLSITSSFSFPL